MKSNIIKLMGRVSSLAVIAGFAVMGGSAYAQSAPADKETADSEIIVTAAKREESIRDVSRPISAVTGQQLQEMGAQSLSDYITRLPGVVFNDYQPGISEVIIRGIAATTYHEQGQATTGYYLNELPLVEPGFPIGIPDVDTFDLQRVEVLRGPQGTLFGSSALGGTINYITNTANTGKVEVAAEGLVGMTKNSDGQLNYAAKAMVNIPLVQDKLAVRVMALQRVDAGWLDNPGVGVDGSNDFRTRGLRGSIVANLGVNTEMTFMSVYQDSKLDDQTYVDITNLYNRSTARLEPQKTSFWMNSLRLDHDFDFARLTVLGAHIKKENSTVFSFPTAEAPFRGYITGNTAGAQSAYSNNVADASIKTFEARLASAGDGPFKWLMGVSYIRAQKDSQDQFIQPGAAAVINANPGSFGGFSGSVLAPNDRIYGYNADLVASDFGIFGELSFKPIEAFEITVGGRYYNAKSTGSVTNTAGTLAAGSFRATDISAQVDQQEDGFTPKVTLSFRPAEDILLYTTYSKGFRAGGTNPNAGFLPSIANSYASDTAVNYEAGLKATLLDRKLYIDAAVFHIDWQGIQARLFGPAPTYYSYVTNAGSADVTGVEFSAMVRPTSFLSFGTNITYNDGKLSTFLPDTFAPGGGYAAGTTLPGSSKWSVSNNLKFEFAETGGSPSFEIAHRYLSKAPTAFSAAAERGGYSMFDVRASVNVGEKVTLLAFVNNIFDKKGVLNAPFANAFAPFGTITKPRVIGLKVNWAM